MSNVILIDADSLVWSCSYNVESENEAKEKLDQHIMKIVSDIEEEVGSCWVQVFFGQTGRNFRKDVDESYKANRKYEKPEYFMALADYVREEYHSKSAVGEEVDDLIAKSWKALTLSGSNVIIASIDKDYYQLPAKIYSWHTSKQFVDEVSEDDAHYNFWFQMLEGDKADNVKGVPGIGPKKAQIILSDSKTRFGRVRRVVSTYMEKYGENGLNEARKTYRLLKLG